jgi:DNA-binding transcriptional MerR regulator
MGQYSIKELEKLSGIKAHTIRIWEKRHNIIQPSRTETNIRYYSDEDLKKIMNVSLLNTHGIKISKIAEMSFDEINRMILDMSEAKSDASLYIDQLVVAMVDMEEERFEKTLNTVISHRGFQECVTQVIYPFMEKIGVLWQTKKINPAQEHFISNLIRQKLINSIAALPLHTKKGKKAILFLPEGDLHEIGLLFYHYIARSKGFKTFYLGQSVPYEDLKTVYQIHQPTILITSFISAPSPQQLENYIHSLSKDFPEATILASGMMMRKTAFLIPKNVKPFYRATELPALLDHFLV